MIGGMLAALGVGLAAAIVGIFAAIIGILAIFFFAIIGALIGAITGFILQHVPILGPLVIQGFHAVGIRNPDLTAIGAMLGFVGGFFKSAASHDNGKNC